MTERNSHLALDSWRSDVQEVEEVPDEVELLAQVRLADGGAAQRQHLGEQLEAVSVGSEAAEKKEILRWFKRTRANLDRSVVWFGFRQRYLMVRVDIPAEIQFSGGYVYDITLI